MTAAATRDLRETASELRARLGAQRDAVPVDIEQLALLHGLRIERCDQGITGVVVHNTDGVALSGLLDFTTGRLFVDGTQIATRQRFTIAHELAHEVLGHEDVFGTPTHGVPDMHEASVVTDHSDAENGIHAAEREADELAGHLLVPRDLLVRTIAQLGSISVPLLADCFAVSVAAMQMHVRRLIANDDAG
ncbi:MAG: ImmA/IrrE family metallo-endopeptidase [Thermoleophilia bacterium]|nr:ImmA/IrrE family metallo-endopeptidase [Thermoleophilia bacterium]